MKPNISFTPNNMTATDGLTTRDYIAIEAMKGILSNSSVKNLSNQEAVAEKAFQYADALIKESNKKME